MNRRYLSSLIVTLIVMFFAHTSQAGFFDDLTSSLGLSGGTSATIDDSTIARGLKEALATGTTRAVKAVSRTDGYFGNQAIKILVPEKIRSTTQLLAEFGYRKQVDDFVLAMNRAAEKAAPKATDFFVEALTAMTFEDARAILNGGQSSATEYFRQKTGDKIYEAFKPVVTGTMKDVGVARSYAQITEKYERIRFAGLMPSFDLDHYVTTKAVDGLFITLGEEEKKIRTDPAARGTELLRKVFGK
jgi:hypothetical protein